MKFFLKYVNPVLALAVLVICLIAASTEQTSQVPTKMQFVGFFRDPISTYFLAKGIFCSAALFLLGKLVEQGIAAGENARDRNNPHSRNVPEPPER